jgi:HAD superfamily hydrolase (TIGR01509 family)
VGFELTERQYREIYLVQGKSAFRLAEERGIPRDTMEELRRIRRDRYNAMLQRGNLLIDGAREVVEALHGKFLMGIVTSSLPEHFATIHQSTGLLPYFDFVLASGDYARSKPHPDPYLAAVERSGCRKEECLAIEDSERGLAAAIAAGIRCIVVPNELTKGCPFTGAYKVLHNLSELLLNLADYLPSPKVPAILSNSARARR